MPIVAMNIDYAYSPTVHSVAGPRAALPAMLDNVKPASLLDVGCGIGTWLSVAADLGITDIFGVDGIDIPQEALLVSRTLFACQDLTQPLRLGRNFEVALCLEVAEHLEPKAGEVLIRSLTDHADIIFFSAACPGQFGQHHINCQWPHYWQERFNAHGYACNDAVRWKIWNDPRIEPWYRQNLFIARRDRARAGSEARILPVIHPNLIPYQEIRAELIKQVEQGCMKPTWYLSAAASGIWAKLHRRLV